MIRVSVLGHLGADPELRSSQKGLPIVSFRVAVNLARTGANARSTPNGSGLASWVGRPHSPSDSPEARGCLSPAAST